MDSIYLAHTLYHLWPLVEKIINLWGQHEEENFLLSLGRVGFWANILFHAFI